MSGERYSRIFVTGDGTLTVSVDAPAGFVLPPTLELHKPMVGTVVFYDAESFGIVIRAEEQGGDVQ